MATTIEKVEQEIVLLRRYQSKWQSSLERGVPFLLTFAQYKRIVLRKTCYYTGVRFQDEGATQLTLDRIDATIGYTEENTVPCIDAINKAKALFEKREHINIHHLIKACEKM